MAIFKGIQHGRAAYPLYLADSYKPQEPTALGLLAQLGLGRAKAPKKEGDGTEKDPKIEAIQAQTVYWWNMKESTDALEKQNEMMGKAAFSSYQSDPDKFQKSEEGKQYFNTLVEIERRKSILNKNIPVGKSNLEKLTSARKSLQEKNSAGLFALSPNYNTYRIDEKTNTLVENAPGDVTGAITKDAYNNWIDKTQGSDPATGLFKQIEPMSGIDQDAFKKKLMEQIKLAKETEGGKRESGLYSTNVPGLLKSTTRERIHNTEKLAEVTWNTFANNMTKEDSDAAHQMYYNALKNGYGGVYKSKEVEKTVNGKKVKVPEYIRDDNGDLVKKDFSEYMYDVVKNSKDGVGIDYQNYTEQYVDQPGWREKYAHDLEEEPGSKYWSLFLAGREAVIDPVTGERYTGLEYKKGIMDFGEVLGTTKDVVLGDIFGESGRLYIKSLQSQYNHITPSGQQTKEGLNEYIMKNMGAENMSKYYRYINNSQNKGGGSSGDWWNTGIYTNQLNALGGQTIPRTSMLNGQTSSGVYNPLLLLTENELKTYDIKITTTPTNQNEGARTKNMKINSNMTFRGDGGIEYKFNQEIGTSNSPIPVFSTITDGLIINNGSDTKNIAVGNIVVADKKQLKNVKFKYYDVAKGKMVEGNAYDDDDKTFIRTSKASLELGSDEECKKAGMNPNDDVWIVSGGTDATVVIPNTLDENKGDKYTHVLLPAQRADVYQNESLLNTYTVKPK